MIESHVLRTTNGAYITKPNNMPKNHQAVFQKELKYPDPESIFKVAETLSGDCFLSANHCSTMAVSKKVKKVAFI